MPAPRVSVICIFFNAERFFSEAIESVLAQDFADFELILADDGSTDASTAMAKAFCSRNPGRVHYLEHPGHVNQGMSATRNLGLASARGEFVAFIDADDRWHPDKLSKQVAILDADPGVGFVSGKIRYWRSWEGGKDTLQATGGMEGGVRCPPETSLALYPLGRFIPPCPSDVMVRRSIVEKVGGFEPHFTGQRQLYDDVAFFAKVWLETCAHFSGEVWLDYRQHAASCVSTVKREGHYSDVQAYFLDWFAGYLERRGGAEAELVAAAVRGARWRVRYPSLSRINRKLQRMLQP